MDAIAEIGSAFLTIAPSLRGFGGALNAQAGGTIRSSGKSLGATFGKAFILGGSLLAAAGIGGFLKDSIGEAREAQKVGALTANVIKQTGGVANISAAQVGKLTSAISLKTGIDDEAIQSGANLLLTFKNVRNEVGKGNDVFNRATQAATDLSAAGFGDLNGASKQLGKALNDPVKGITALSRSGVTFTAQQQAQIKTLTASGRTLEAQKIILGEVESQVGGAAAAASTYGEKASVAFGNIKEQVGTALLPVIDGFFQLFLRSVPTITSLINGIGPAFGRVQAFIAPFVNQVQGFFSGGGGGGLLTGLQSIGATIRANVLPVLQTMSATFTGTVLPAIASLATYVGTALLPIFQQVAGIVVSRVIPILASLATFFYGTLYPAVIRIVAAVAQNLKPVFDQLVATFQSSVLPAVNQLLAAFQRAQPTLQRVAVIALRVVGAVLQIAAAVLGKVLPVIIRFSGFVISRMVPALISLVSGIAKAVGAVISFGRTVVNAVKFVVQFQAGVAKQIVKVVKFFTELPGKVTGALAGLPGKMLSIGGNIVDGLVRGIRNAAGRVLDAVKSLVDKIPKKIRQIMGIASPSKVTTILGQYISDGLAKGIENGSKKVTKAVGKVLDKAQAKLEERISDFKSLSDSVGSNLAGNLFSGFDTSNAFTANLGTVKGNLGAALTDFKALKGFGLSGQFLAQLFSSGGFPLIHELAANQGQAVAAASIFGDIQNLSGQLGAAVAINSPDIGGGATLQDLQNTLKETNKLLQKVPDGVAKGVNGAATAGKQRGNKGKGKK